MKRPWMRKSCTWSLLALALGWVVPSATLAKTEYLATFRTTYPAAAGSRIDSCNVCHSVLPQLNSYGTAFADADRSYPPTEPLDSDGDGAVNVDEIAALTFPGDPNDSPPPLPSPTPSPTEPPPTPSATATATTAAQVCTCDCSADEVVTVDELLKAVNIALGLAAVDICLPADRDGNGAVTIDELLAGVTAALNGCA